MVGKVGTGIISGIGQGENGPGGPIAGKAPFGAGASGARGPVRAPEKPRRASNAETPKSKFYPCGGGEKQKVAGHFLRGGKKKKSLSRGGDRLRNPWRPF